MENFTLNCLVELARRHRFKKITGEYIPTRKNDLVKDHYAGLGFTATKDGRWELDTDSYENRKTFISRYNEQHHGSARANQPAK